MPKIKGWRKINKTTWINRNSGSKIEFGRGYLGWKAVLNRCDYSFPDWSFKKYISVDGEYTVANCSDKEELWKMVLEWMKNHPNG